jgi:hypothetical protein
VMWACCSVTRTTGTACLCCVVGDRVSMIGSPVSTPRCHTSIDLLRHRFLVSSSCGAGQKATGQAEGLQDCPCCENTPQPPQTRMLTRSNSKRLPCLCLWS